MRLVVIAGAIATLISFLGTPLLINLLRRHGYSQAIRASREGESVSYTHLTLPTNREV